jgi:hypothetical protein
LTREQLELVLEARAALVAPARRPARRTTVARWWFARMREAVRRAAAAAPAPRPEQIHFALPAAPRRLRRIGEGLRPAGLEA